MVGSVLGILGQNVSLNNWQHCPLPHCNYPATGSTSTVISRVKGLIHRKLLVGFYHMPAL
jgi:hypothetical protein